MPSSSAFVAPDHHNNHPHHSLPQTEQLCYVRCHFCDTVSAVSVPCTSFFKTVTARCGHCTNLLSVNLRSPLLLQEELPNSLSNLMLNQPNIPNESLMPVRGVDELPLPPVANRPPEKSQRVPSAYNRSIKEEIQRIKAENPDISHREAFRAAAKNWAHFPHIHFGLMPDQPVKKSNICQQEGEDVLMKDGFLAPSNIGIAPY